MGEIQSLADLRPGDACFTKIGGLVPGVFPVAVGMLALGDRVRLGRIRFDHVLIVTEGGEAPKGVQAMPDGAEEIALTPERHWNNYTAFCRLPEDWPGQAADAAAIARLMIDTPYSFASYLALAAALRGIDTPRLNQRINRRHPEQITLPSWSNGPDAMPPGRTRGGRLPVEMICSVLFDQAWTLAGKQVMPEGTRPQVVNPGGLGMQLWRTPGAIWGGAALL